MRLLSNLTLAVFALACGCSGDEGGGGVKSVPATARILKGPTGAPAALAGFAGGTADGQWIVTADQTTLTFVRLEFDDLAGGPQHVQLTNCNPTYSSDAATLSTLLDCPFDIPLGTWRRVGVAISTTFTMNLFDDVNGLYTDPSTASGLSTTAPPAPIEATFTVALPGDEGIQVASAWLEPPLVVSSTAQEVTISLVADMLHAVGLEAAAGALALSLQVPPVVLMPSVEGAGRVHFYSHGPGAQNWNSSVTPSGNGSPVRVFYPAQTGQPGFLFHPVLGPSEAYAGDASDGGAGGYLGVDSTNKLCWAHADSDSDWSGYAKVCVMQLSTSLGATTSLSCQSVTDAPPPLSGATYASGCPAITPDETYDVRFVAE